ncbi:MAG: hypothetical protein K8R76_06895 [Candidatus Aegiribacteria sp.]|nr:hypothetical protein [Candidatus Aegiribacteria sp.]
MICQKCGTEHHSETIGFKAYCESCGSYLHTCIQCSIYDHKAEKCRSLTTEAVRDRGGINFCEEYMPEYRSPSSLSNDTSDAKDSFNKLFGDPDHKLKQKRKEID